MEPPAPVSDDVFHWTKEEREAHGVDVLPGTLEEALNVMGEDDVVRRADDRASVLRREDVVRGHH